MKFRPLTVNSLPRVMINLLAFEDEEIVAFVKALNECDEMKTWFETVKMPRLHVDKNREHPDSVGHTRLGLSEFFVAILALSKVVRSMFVKDFDRILSDLGSQDFWGTEGQCDPRGDRRELLGY